MLTGLCGCHSLNTVPASLAENIPIPENGVIPASVFEKLKQKNEIVTLNGESNGIVYQWTIFGSSIEKAGDLNLAVDITQADKEKLVFDYLSDETFEFSPMLSIYLNESWNVQNATLYEVMESDLTAKCQVSITGKRNHILNFSFSAHKGTFVILPNSEQNTTSFDIETFGGGTGSSSKAFDTTVFVPEETSVSQRTDKQTQTEPPSPFDTGVEPAETQKITELPKPTEIETQTEPPAPAESENQEIHTKNSYTCTFSIECSSIFNHIKELDSEKLDILPENGIIFETQAVTFYEGESVYNVLQRICKENKIHLEATLTPVYNSAYVEGIQNLYEFDCGSSSGWMYRVNGWYPNYGCSSYQLKQGDVVEWRYTCELGSDINGGNNLTE